MTCAYIVCDACMCGKQGKKENSMTWTQPDVLKKTRMFAIEIIMY